MTYNYSYIKELAKARGEKVSNLLALSANNDPFYTGKPAEIKKAEWFAELWQQFGYTTGVHLRRVHYRLVSQSPSILRPDGIAYENTDRHWAYLCEAGKKARYLGFVDFAAFVDRRNPEAIINSNFYSPNDLWYEDPNPIYNVHNEWDTHPFDPPQLPQLADLPAYLPDLPNFESDGYTSVQQSVLVEVWCEKTTMNDILGPLCQRYNVNLVAGAGELSITAAFSLMERIEKANRSAQILYISDYDPAGVNMPLSIARKLEFFQRAKGFDDLIVRLEPIILTKQQINQYNLPYKPGKDKRWNGIVELDALEALHPGELERIVKQEILKYFDTTLHDRSQEALQELDSLLDMERDNVLTEYQERLGQLDEDYGELQENWQQLQEQFTVLIIPFQEAMASQRLEFQNLVEQHQKLCRTIVKDLKEVEVDTPPIPKAELEDEGEEQLYNSHRTYLEQLDYYQDYKEATNGNGGN